MNDQKGNESSGDQMDYTGYWDAIIEFLRASRDVLEPKIEACIVKRTRNEKPSEEEMLFWEGLVIAPQFKADDILRQIAIASNRIQMEAGFPEKTSSIGDAIRWIRAHPIENI